MKLRRSELAGRIIDIHAHSGGVHFTHYFHEIFPYCCNVRELVLCMEKHGVDYSVSFPVPYNTCTDGLPLVDRQVAQAITADEPCLYYWANRRLLMETRMYGEGKILPFVCLSLYGDYHRQISHIKELMDENDIYGIKIHTAADQTNLTKIIEDKTVKAFVEEARLPIIIHSGMAPYCDSNKMCDVFEALPYIRFCVAHAGMMKACFINRLKNMDNVWIDVSPIYKLPESLSKTTNSEIIQLDYSRPQSIIEFFLNTYPDKILFGTDYPWVACGNLEKHKNFPSEDYYKKSIDLLKSYPEDIALKCANKNCCDFLFGY